MIDGSCFFAIFVSFDLLAASFPAQNCINDALRDESGTSFDLVSRVLRFDI